MKNLLFLALLAPSITYALRIDFQPQGICVGNADCEQALQDAEDQANADIPSISEDDYAAGISNSVNYAYKGSGSDYSDNFAVFVVKASGGVGVQSEDPTLKDTDKLEGIGAGAAVTLGLNLDLLPVDKIGSVEFKKLDVFLSFMSYSMDNEFDDFAFDGDISTIGLFARYRLIDSVSILPGSLLEWGGLHLHTGIQKSTMNLSLSQNFKGTETSGAYTINYDADAVFDIESSVTSIPIELSTYLRAGYILTLFGGAGFDINMGNTDVTLSGDGDLEQDGTGTPVGTVIADGDGSGSPEATNFRAFGGLQFNIPFVRVYAQVNKSLGSDVLGANAGVKILW